MKHYLAVRLSLSIARHTLNLIALLVIVGSLALLTWFAVDDAAAERKLYGYRPAQYYHPIADPLDDYGAVFGIAHNSGDSIGATRDALNFDANVIEIDVIALDGRLYAAHEAPTSAYGKFTFRGPLLSDAWKAARSADAIALDLKQSSPRYMELVISFLSRHPEQRVIVSSDDPASLRLLSERVPEAIRLLSVTNERGFQQLQSDPELVRLIDGVGIRHTLLDEASAAWLRQNDMLILAWTVNDPARFKELIDYGVDGITTDNLAIVELLGRRERGDEFLRRGTPADFPATRR